jgi:hypothetical protein
MLAIEDFLAVDFSVAALPGLDLVMDARGC